MGEEGLDIVRDLGLAEPLLDFRKIRDVSNVCREKQQVICTSIANQLYYAK
jgi:hypothetical protein